MFPILNRALSWAITSFANEFCVKKRLRLIEALDNGFYVKFMQLEISLFELHFLFAYINCLSNPTPASSTVLMLLGILVQA